MGKFKGKFRLVKRRDDYYRHFTALDIGTDMVKALVIRRDRHEGIVLGVGREPQEPIAMSGGAIADIESVIRSTNRALEAAEDMAGLNPPPGQAVVGVAGELVKGFCSSAAYPRTKPDSKIREGEIRNILNLLQKRALREAHSAPDRPGTEGLEDTERELNETQVEVQELAAGIHPPLLSQRGLGPALSSLAKRAPCPVRLVVSPRRLPAVIETTVYFVCSEALTNVAKYARASRVDVEVRSLGDTVTVLIADDGVGGADPEAGSGLMGLADRIQALGGRFLVESPVGRGTRLRAHIPTLARWSLRTTATSS